MSCLCCGSILVSYTRALLLWWQIFCHWIRWTFGKNSSEYFYVGMHVGWMCLEFLSLSWQTLISSACGIFTGMYSTLVSFLYLKNVGGQSNLLLRGCITIGVVLILAALVWKRSIYWPKSESKTGMIPNLLFHYINIRKKSGKRENRTKSSIYL